ncbi:MAG: PAS domain S-box protein [bacterium]|nr:PAS domain S-box protein [bacterium]
MTKSKIRSERRIARGMTLRWVPGLAVLAALALAGFLIFDENVRSVEATASLINEAGRQRVLSQRAALRARHLANLPVAGADADRAPIRSELGEIAQQMASVHSRLLAGEPLLERPDDMPAALARIFEEPPHELDRRCRSFVAAVVSLAEDKPLDFEALETVLEIAEEGTFLGSLDAVANELERYTESRLRRSRRALVAVTLANLAVLVVLSLAVFRPMVRNTRRHLRRLREQGEEHRLTLDSALTSIAVVDPAGLLTTANRFLCQLTGYDESELIGSRWLDLIHPDNAADAEELLTRVLAGEAGFQARPMRLVTRSGEVRSGLIRCGVQLDENDEPVRVVIHFEDSTERLKAEEEARQSRERLAQVDRVTAMGEMAGGLAHEINQPLTAIASYAQACRRWVESGKVESGNLMTTLGKIGEQALRAGKVIRRLRTFVSRHETGAEVVDLNAVVTEAVALAEADARMHGCAIETVLSADLEPVIADPIQLEQVVLNLIRNGIEAHQDTGAAARVLVSTSALGSEAVEVTVVDNGKGLPDKPEKLFEPFYSTKTSGMGMGLSISRTLVASHGGRLWCQPNSDGGAAFLFSIPTAVENRRRMLG